MHYLAEYLARIKSIAVSIQLDTGCKVDSLEFEGLRNGVLRYHDAEGVAQTEKLVLPEDVKPSVAQLGFPIQMDSNSVSFRLPTSPELHIPKPKTPFFLDNPKVVVPWSAKDLTPEMRIGCAGCSATLIRPNQLHTFKPLPSENWAEMMDFWHCHKPNEEGETSSNPAYSISKFAPSKGNCLVGLSYLLLNKQDLPHLECEECGRVLGQLDNNEETMRLWKWNMQIDGADSYPYYYYVSATISELIESHAMYTFQVECKETEELLLLWVFNPHIRFTTTHSVLPSNGFKVFYSEDKTKIPSLAQTRGEVEEVSIPKLVYQSLINRLRESTGAFPSNARGHGDWVAGVLDKL